jgi:hypothetical protein
MTTTEENEQPQQKDDEATPRRGKIKRCWHWVATHKKLTIPAAVAVLVALLTLIPFTRFAIAGTFLKQSFKVVVVDQKTKKPVSSAEVTVAGKAALTDGQGRATIKARVGQTQLTVEKKYYKNASQSVLVPILKQKQTAEVKLEATGRQVPIVVVNKITKKAVAGVSITAGDAKAKTDKEGKAMLVVPADKEKIEASFSADGYNVLKQTVPVTIDGKSVEVAMIPAGKIYFLSNLTGKLDVVKSNLDGSDRQVVLAGTGNEDKSNTLLLASRDWKYMALLSKRDGGEYAKLFLIETATDKLTTMDEGKADFTIYGWADHRFVYKVSRAEIKSWQPNHYALKSYDATARKITTLDQTQAEGSEQGYAAQNFGTVYLVNNQAIYTVSWDGWSAFTNGKSSVIRGVQTNGQGKKDYKAFDNVSYVSSSPYKFNEIYYQVWDNQAGKDVYYEFADNKVEQVQINESDFGQGYPTRFISPSANLTFWGETRDGKAALFVGDKDGKNEKQVAALSEYDTFGWFTDEYLLVSKKSSELYILPAAGLSEGQQPQKLTDYYRPAYFIRGYGGGY